MSSGTSIQGNPARMPSPAKPNSELVDGLHIWLSWLTGLLLPVYFLDESISLKAPLLPLMAACLLLLSAFLNLREPKANGAWQLALAVLAIGYVTGLFASGYRYGLAANALYPLLFMLLCWNRPDTFGRLAKGLALGILAVVMLGTYRFVTGEGGLPTEHLLGYWGIKYTEATRNSDALAPLLACLIALAATVRGRELGVPSWLRPLWWGVLGLSLPTLVLTYSRSAWLALLVFALAFAGAGLRRLLVLGLASALSLLVLVVVVVFWAPGILELVGDAASLLERLRSIYDPTVDSSNAERRRLLAYAFDLGWSYPLLGAGSGRFECCFTALGYLDLRDALHPENLFFHLLSEFGMPVAAAAVLLFVSAIASGLRPRADIRQRAAGAFLLAMFTWLQFNSELPSLLVWVLLGLSMAAAVPAGGPRKAEA